MQHVLYHSRNQAADMIPLDVSLLPEAFASAFGLPAARFDQSDAGPAGLPFSLPLPAVPVRNLESRRLLAWRTQCVSVSAL